MELGELDVSGLKASQIHELAMKARQSRAHFARNDACEFMRFVLRDEETGEPILQCRNHDLMQAICDEYDRAVILAHIESGKTNQITIGRTLYEIGRNPNLRGAIVSNTETQAVKFMTPIKTIIERSLEFRLAFPEVAPSIPWQETRITVTRSRTMKDPTIQALGIHGNIIGSRLDWVVADDLLDPENTATKAGREDVWEWFHASIMGRLTRNARVFLLGTAWHKQDILHRLGKRKAWYFRRFPAIDSAGNPTYPERWSRERIEAAKEGDFTDIEFDRQLRVIPPQDETSSFNEEYIKTCSRLGVGLPLCPDLESLMKLPASPVDQPPRNEEGKFEPVPMMFSQPPPIFLGVDLAAKRTKRSAKTAIFVVAIRPNGKKQIVWIEAGKWDGPKIRDRIIDNVDRFGAIGMVENNAVQEWILQFVEEEQSGLPLYPFTTGKNKADPQFGVESLSLEMRNAGWIIPCETRGHDEFVYDDPVEEWIGALREHDPLGHTNDLIMAQWFAREAARRFLRTKKKQGIGVRVIG